MILFSKPKKYRSPFQIEMLQDLIKKKKIKIRDFKMKFGNPGQVKLRVNQKYQEFRRERGLFATVNIISMVEEPHVDRYKRNTTIGYYVINDIAEAKELLKVMRKHVIGKKIHSSLMKGDEGHKSMTGELKSDTI